MNLARYSRYLWLSGVLLIVLLFRTIPAWRAPLGHFGYDYGFYLYAFEHASLASVKHSLAQFSSGYDNLLFWLASVLGLSSETVLIIIFLALQLIVGLVLYWLLAKQSRLAAVFAVLLFAVSLPQNEASLMFLFKYSVGLILLLAGFKFLLDKKYLWFAGTTLLLLFSHRSTFIIYTLTVTLYFIYYLWQQRQRNALIFYLLLLGGIAGLIYQTDIFALQSLLSFSNPAVTMGIFLDQYNFVTVTLPYLILAVTGFATALYRKHNPLFLIFFIVSFLWLLLGLPFYNRVFLYWDLSLILLSSYLVTAIKLPQRYLYSLMILVIIITAVITLIHLSHQQPLISREEIKEIQNFTINHPGGFILALDSVDAPWLLAYQRGVRLAAPGLFEDRHNHSQWLSFWQKPHPAFLAAYPPPLFIYHKSFPLPPDFQCAQPLTKNFSHFICH